MKRLHTLIFIIAAAIILLIGIRSLVISQQSRPSEANASHSGMIGTWSEKIRALGAQQAYKEYRDMYAKAPFSEQHLAAHAMGTALYSVLGLQGLGTCDQVFAFGCYHGFFARAIAETGTKGVSALADECHTKFGNEDTGCKHGIGHGIMEYEGPDNLVTALSLCDATHQGDSIFGCTDGVFMEYNNSISFPSGSAVARARPFDARHPNAPCDSVPLSYRVSCNFEIALWWRYIFGLDYGKVGNMCNTVSDQAERSACYRGWGTVVAENVAYTASKAKLLCDRIHTSDGPGECLIGVAMRFFGTGTQVPAGLEVCKGLPSPLNIRCQALAPDQHPFLLSN